MARKPTHKAWQSRDRFVRHRAGKNVAADHDAIDVRVSNLVKDRFERGKGRLWSARKHHPHLKPRRSNLPSYLLRP